MSLEHFNLRRHYTSIHKVKYDKYTGCNITDLKVNTKTKVPQEASPVVLRIAKSMFLEQNITADTSASCKKLRDTEFLCHMAFLTDAASQARGQPVRNLLVMWSGSTENRIWCPIHRKTEAFPHMWGAESTFNRYSADINTLDTQFHKRFIDFQNYAVLDNAVHQPSLRQCEWPPAMQMELCELQSDLFVQSKRDELGIAFFLETVTRGPLPTAERFSRWPWPACSE